MKLLTVLGTRPEIIRLSRVIPKLDALASERGGQHIVLDTGQNFEPTLSALFYDQLGVREPDERLGVRGSSFGERVAAIIARAERSLTAHRPDGLLVLGDKDSGLAAFVAKRMGVKVFHMEAGNRCYDDRVAEEVNRRVIDHCSDLLMPYTQKGAVNLAAEGIGGERVQISGNPIKEVIDRHAAEVEASDVLERFEVESGRYMVLTAHRQENVDRPERLAALVEGVVGAARDTGLPLICSVHPRTEARLREWGGKLEGEGVITTRPLGFFDFVRLERDARCVITDSGTVQEECCLFGVPVVTVRDTTERPETVECGSNVVSGLDPDRIRSCVADAVAGYPDWVPPPEYLYGDVSDRVTRIVASELTSQ